MEKGLHLKLLVEFSAVFDEEPKDLETYLTGISRSMLLNVAAFFLGFSNRKSKYENYKNLLETFFCAENNSIANQIYFKLMKLEDDKRKEIIIIQPQSSLQLFEYCFDNLSNDETQKKAEAEVNIFKAYLYLNEQNTTKEQTAFISTKNLPQWLRIAGISLSQSYPYSELINYDIKEVFVGQIIKSIFLFEFLETNPKTQLLLVKFNKHFNCSDWKEYLNRFLPLTFSLIKAEQEANIDLIITRDENFKENCEFIDKLIAQESDTMVDYDFKTIRSKPFYRVSEGVYRIIYSLFVVEKIFKGLYFILNEINKTLPLAHKMNNFRGIYCNDFSEKQLIYKLLNSIYENRYIEFSGEIIKQHGINAEPDYYIRKGNYLFIFESKDILINSVIKTSYDYNKYEREFKKKLYFDDNKGKIENKAVLQLLNNIKRVLSKQFSFDTNYNEGSLYIYPIIILHDHQFNVAGLNVLVNYWFQEEINKLNQLGFNTDRVRPIVIIDIDTLILHQDILRDRTIKLENVLDNYYKFIKFNTKKKYRDEEHATEYRERTVVSFSLFLANYVSKKKIGRIPKMLKEKVFSLFS
ncbi:MAG: hypothetical protein FVQ77_07525 [Cytophagales bacterium]|nr:hypothetical protein [Cytophagales bacterium]